MAESVRVLLVDDEPDFQEAIAFWLTSKGYQVSRASNGEAALDLIRQQPPDVIFLDVNMPGIDGIETLRRLRAFNKTLPVILVTAAVGDENQFSGAKALGISGLFPKGTSLSELTQVLQVALRMLRTQLAASATAAAPPSSWFSRLARKLFPRSP